MNIEIANRLQKLRKENGYSQEELADKLGISRQAISKWERAESSPDTDNLIILAKLYGISLDDLLNSDESTEDIRKRTEDVEEEKNSILSDDEGNSIKMEEDGITLTDSDGSSVRFGKDDYVYITYKDGKTKKINKKEYFNRKHPIIGAMYGVTALIATIAYLILGFSMELGFGNYWFLFILIPVIPSIFEAILKKKITEFNYPCLITAVYCALGMICGLWHPLWILFITIPVFYIVFGQIDKHVLKSKYMEYDSIEEDVKKD